jgi:hypothetical protein
MIGAWAGFSSCEVVLCSSYFAGRALGAFETTPEVRNSPNAGLLTLNHPRQARSASMHNIAVSSFAEVDTIAGCNVFQLSDPCRCVTGSGAASCTTGIQYLKIFATKADKLSD